MRVFVVVGSCPTVNGIWKFPFGREVPMPAFNAQLRGLDGDTATDFAGSSLCLQGWFCTFLPPLVNDF